MWNQGSFEFTSHPYKSYPVQTLVYFHSAQEVKQGNWMHVACVGPYISNFSFRNIRTVFSKLGNDICPGVRTNVVIPSRLQFEITKWQAPEVGFYKLSLENTHTHTHTHRVALTGYGKSSADVYREKRNLRFWSR